jgi:hypothetical protein
MRRTPLAHGLAIAALLTGCAQNAFFELQVELPANPAGQTWFAQIQVRDTNQGFAIPWMGGDLPTVPLGDARQWDCLSVESLDAQVSLHVRVRFCRSEDCLDLEDGDPPERLYSFETPFYIGSRTYFRVVVPRIPVCATDTDCDVGVCLTDRCRCSIEGCIEGPVSATFCSTETDEHFCERNPDIRRDETYMCPAM